MEAVAKDSAVTPGHLGFIYRLRVLAACGVAILLLGTAGWHVAAPLDSELGLTLTRNGQGILTVWPVLLALCAVSALIGTIIAGQRLPEAGVFATAIGLAAMSLRGGSMQTVLAYFGTSQEAGRRTLMLAMAWDTVLFAAILAVSWIAATAARAWLWPERETVAEDRGNPEKAASKTSQAELAKWGWSAWGITTAVAAFIIWLTIARTPVAEIVRGQVIASVTAGLFLGAMAARSFTRANDARWYVLAVPAVALIGYLLGYLNADMSWTEGSPYQPFAALATTPPHELARPLPIEYIAVGVAAVIGGFWSGERIHHAADRGGK